MLYALILYVNGGTYSLKSAPNDRFFRKFFIYSQCFEQYAAERKFQQFS